MSNFHVGGMVQQNISPVSESDPFVTLFKKRQCITLKTKTLSLMHFITSQCITIQNFVTG